MKLLRHATLACFAAAAAVAVSGCIVLPGSNGDVPSTSADILYLAVAAPAANADPSDPTTAFQRANAGLTVVYDNSNPDSPRIMCVHDDPGVHQKMAENHDPDPIGCMAGPASPSTPGTVSGGPGTESLPPGIGRTWTGYAQGGGCGTWATAMCNRILGDTPDGPVSEDEWNRIAIDQKQDPNTGGTSPVDIASYYRDKGYCVADQKFGGASSDYQAMLDKFNKGCDVKMMFYTRNADGTYSNGHVETVTGVSLGGATTNSWGQQGIVQGGSNGGFSHSPQFNDQNGANVWPANGTDVWVSYVCKCGTFDRLVQAAGL
jgi:hypothetical protein